MSDLIDRQAAIETLSEYGNGRTVYIGAEEAIRRIEQLPPAQQKIIRCKDCDWWTKQEDSLQGRCARYGMYPTGYWYCASARERQEE